MLERRRPLPAGRYWLDVFEPKRITWEVWQRVMSRDEPDSPAPMRVEVTEHFDSDGSSPSRDFVIFRTARETVWVEDLGSPTVAGEDIHSSADTVQRPDPEPDPLDAIREGAKGVAGSVGTATMVVAGVVAVGLAVGIAVHVGRHS